MRLRQLNIHKTKTIFERNLLLLPLSYLGTFVDNKFQNLFWGFRLCFTDCVAILPDLDYCDVMISLKLSSISPLTWFFFNSILAILGPSYFQACYDQFIHFYKKEKAKTTNSARFSIRIVLNWYINFGRIDLLVILTIPVQGYILFLYLFRSSLICLSDVLRFFV